MCIHVVKVIFDYTQSCCVYVFFEQTNKINTKQQNKNEKIPAKRKQTHCKRKSREKLVPWKLQSNRPPFMLSSISYENTQLAYVHIFRSIRNKRRYWLLMSCHIHMALRGHEYGHDRANKRRKKNRNSKRIEAAVCQKFQLFLNRNAK